LAVRIRAPVREEREAATAKMSSKSTLSKRTIFIIREPPIDCKANTVNNPSNRAKTKFREHLEFSVDAEPAEVVKYSVC